MSNEYDEAARLVSMRDLRHSAAAGYSAAVNIGEDPDYYAELKRVAQRTGVPINTAVNRPDEIRKQDTVDGVDFEAMAEEAPATARLFSNVEKAKVSYDNLPSLIAIEKGFREEDPERRIDKLIWFLETLVPDPIKRGYQQGKQGLSLLLDQTGLFSGLERQRKSVANAYGVSYDPKIERAVSLADQQRRIEYLRPSSDVAEGMVEISEAGGFIDSAKEMTRNPAAVLDMTLSSIGQSVPAMGATIIGSATGPGGAAIGAGLGSFVVEYGNSLQESMAESGVDGMDPSAILAALNNPELMAAARDRAYKRGVPVAFFDALTAGFAGKLLAGAKPSVLSRASRVAGEAALQAGGGATGEAAAQLATGEFKPGEILLEAVAEMPTAFIEVPANYQIATEKAQAAQRNAEFVENLNNLSAADKLLARDPETFEQFVADVAGDGPIRQVFIDAQVLMQTGLADQLADLSPSVASQLDTAVATGGQIAIPVEEYAARIAPTEQGQALLDHLKIDPEGFSRAEAQDFMQNQSEELRAEVERVLSERQDDEVFQAGRDAVRGNIRNQLDAAGRFTPEVNERYATLAGSYYAVTAHRLGISPEEFYERYPLNIAVESLTTEEGFGQTPGNIGSWDQRIAPEEWVQHPEGQSVRPVIVKSVKSQAIPGDIKAALSKAGQESDGRIRMPHGDILIGKDAVGKILSSQRKSGLALRLRLSAAQNIQKLIEQSVDVAFTKDTKRGSARDFRHSVATMAVDGESYAVRLVSRRNPGETDWQFYSMEGSRLIDRKSSEGSSGGAAASLPRGRLSSNRRRVNPSVLLGRSVEEVLSAVKGGGMLFQTAWHGSPHRFDEFSLEHIGSGEGAQSYGWGLYFAGRKEIAEYYRKKLKTGLTLDGKKVYIHDLLGEKYGYDSSLMYKAAAEGRLPEYIDDVAAIADALPESAFWKRKYFYGLARQAEALKGRNVRNDKGQLYEVDIPEDSELLDWDKPFSEQPEAVRKSLESLPVLDEEISRNATGREVYQRISHRKGDYKPAVSEYLNSLGIKGIRYLDGTSRNKGEGSHNYVIFDDAAIEILKTYYQRQTESSPLGWFNPESLTITLGKKANLSTFLHELGHHFLEISADLASRPEAPEPLRQDFQTLLDWFGVDSPETWHSLAFEERRSYHEQFARAFEAYLFEGKAPSLEMQGLFQRFRAWLIAVYKSLKNLNAELNDEVRGVFDRMIATDEQIAAAQQARSLIPLFSSPEQSGMSPEAFAAYQALGAEATEKAVEELQTRGLRDMKWLHNARSRVIRRMQKEVEALRSETRIAVREEVMSRPVYRAWQFLKSRDEQNAGKLSVEALGEMYGGAYPKNENNPGGALKYDRYALLDWRRLTELRMTARESGIHPDIVADIFGFTSGDEMVRELLAARLPDEEIEALTDARMLERHGELISEEAVEQAADEAVHNDVRARFIATELNALSKATGRPRILNSAAKALAAEMIARVRVKDIRPAQYTAAGTRAARAAEKALKSGNIAQAAVEKRNQLINHHAARAALEARNEVGKSLQYLRKFNRKNTDRDKAVGADQVEQIDGLLERFGLASPRGQNKKSLADWLASKKAEGFSPNIPPEMENEAFRLPHNELSLEAFRGLVETVRQIEHLGRQKNKLLTASKQQDFEAAVDEIVESVNRHAGNRQANNRTAATPSGKAWQAIRKFGAEHIKAAIWARILDGGVDGGPMWEYFIRTANARGDMETSMTAEATLKLSKILDPVYKLGKSGGSGQFFPSIGRSLNREERLSFALNTGNAGNLQRLLGGEGWRFDQIVPVLQSLTAGEWRAVQAIWDHFESYRPAIAEKERRLYGREPDWVEPVPFAVTTADGESLSLRGGYYPIRYDPRASRRAGEDYDAEAARDALRGAYTTATTRRSFTKTRVEEVTGRPLLYSLSTLYSGLNEVIHDLAWHEWLIDANRLMKSGAFDRAVRDHYGSDVVEQFKTWIADIAEGGRAATSAGEAALARLRQGVSAAGVGFNAMSAVLQLLGFAQSFVRVRPRWMLRGIAKSMAGPVAAAREARAKSSFMENRARTRFRELNELNSLMQGKNSAMDEIKIHTYALVMYGQSVVDVPTWHGAYEKAVANGNDENTAIALADQAVIDSQGSGQIKDLAGIERGGQWKRLMTAFYSFMNVTLNLGVAQTMTEKNKAKLAVDWLLLAAFPAVMEVALRAALTPGDSDDFDDLESIAKALAAEQISFLFGLFFLGREFSGIGRTLAGLPSYDYRGPAGFRLVGDTSDAITQARQGEFDAAFRKSMINLAGSLFGLPSAQINRMITGAEALAADKTDNPAALVFGYQE